ncbi:MAG: single-stranded-DNA-specific exonuclease RecJ, partial [Gammaproteobacteria bacterium]
MTPVYIRRREIDEIREHSLPDTLHPVMKRIYLGRGITRIEETDHSLQHLLPYHSLSGIETAAAILADAVIRNEKILVVGDFDADGATSCAVAMRAFEMMGITDCHYLVPNRFEYGYGLTPEIVKLAIQQQPDLIMTVDNGISSVEGVARAREHGIKVIVTDHHLAGEILPEANVIVNPNQPGDTFPSKAIAGVGVTFYLMLALRARLKSLQWFDGKNRPYPNLGTLLDIVALGTVADVVPLDRNNRILVQQGLLRIRHGRACPGIQALLKIAKRRPQDCLASDLGFAVGPRLNAAGRIEHMSLGIECLLATDT